MSEGPSKGLPDIAPDVEPSGPMNDELLLQLLAHLVTTSVYGKLNQPAKQRISQIFGILVGWAQRVRYCPPLFVSKDLRAEIERHHFRLQSSLRLCRRGHPYLSVAAAASGVWLIENKAVTRTCVRGSPFFFSLWTSLS
jgi:hypothetical protein